MRRRGPRSDAVANKGRLTAAAGEVFARLGPSARLEDIAAHAGLGVGTAYRHLGTREAALYDAMADRIADLVEIADRADRIADPGEALSWYLTELGTHVAGDRSVMALMSSRGVSPEQADRLRSSIGPRTAALMDRAKATGWLRADVEATDVPMLLACVDRIAQETDAVAPDTWRRFLRIALDGLRGHSATPMTTPALTGRQVAEIGAAATRRPTP